MSVIQYWFLVISCGISDIHSSAAHLKRIARTRQCHVVILQSLIAIKRGSWVITLMGIALTMNVNSKILRIVSFELDITLLFTYYIVEDQNIMKL